VCKIVGCDEIIDFVVTVIFIDDDDDDDDDDGIAFVSFSNYSFVFGIICLLTF
jgi:hypothetical protein